MAFNIKRRFDHNDFFNYLSDDACVGTSDFYRKKFNNKLPNYYYDFFEMKARHEINEDTKLLLVKVALEEKKQLDDKILKEFDERNNLNLDVINEQQ
jgi:hypothetical protein